MANANTAQKANEVGTEEPVTMQVVKNTAESAPQPEPADEAPAPKPELTLEQRITVVEGLTMLIDKWRKLQPRWKSGVP